MPDIRFARLAGLVLALVICSLTQAAAEPWRDGGVAPDTRLLQIHRVTVDPLRDAGRLGSAPRDDAGNVLGLVQFHGPLMRADLAALRARGLEPIQYYPHHAYLVWGPATALDDSGREVASVRFAGEFGAGLRLAPSLERRQGWIRNVNVHFYNTGNVAATVAALSQRGAVVHDYWRAQPDGRLWDARVEVHANDLAALANLPEVISLNFMSPEPQLEDESATQVLAGNLDAQNVPFPGYMSWLASIDLDGSGVIWASTDSGVWYDHPDYDGRIVGGTSYPGCTAAPHPGAELVSGGGHGTHVTGIFAGDGTGAFTDGDGFLYGLGMAPGASIFAQNPICGTQSSWPPAGGWPVLSRDAVLGGAIGSNNSWTSGEGTANGYQNTERTYDLMVLDGNFDSSIYEPFMVVFSAGNSGPGASSLTAPKEAKNVIVTGGTQTLRVSGNVDAMYNASSRGPAVDGRVMPTIAAPGQSVSSAIKPQATSCTATIAGTSGLYSLCTGTSMAAPHASGALILLAEWWRLDNAGQDFSPAMGKALLINSARPISGAGAPPNNDVGWGRVDLSPLLDSDLLFEFWDQTELFDESGQSWTRTVGVVDPSQPLKVTLVWSDAPGAVGANPALVNDLDLRVETGGELYLGNQFDAGVSVPGGSPDRLNNIEQVLIDAPGGSATITVEAFQIAGSVMINDPQFDFAQHFALVCQNCLEQPDFTLDTSPTAASLCLPDDVDVEVQVGSLLGFSDPVNLAATGLPAGVTAGFTVNPVTPPGTSQLNLDAGAAAPLGTHVLQIEASSSTDPKSRAFSLSLFDQVPGQPDLISPADGAVDVEPDPVFEWTGVGQAGSYVLELSTDPTFAVIEQSVETTDTVLSLPAPLATSTVYYWRVRVDNACGSSVPASGSFATRPEPGDCPIGVPTQTLFLDDMESGAGDWIVEGEADGAIGNTWQLTQDRSWIGDWSWHADNPPTISDQRLVSPPVALPGPGNLPLTLRFDNWMEIESATGGNCWDAGILEISTDDGNSWTQIEDGELLSQPYDGTVNNFTSGPNPLAGLRAWCVRNPPRDWMENTVDLSPWAGETVRLRFRLGSDATVGQEGWYVDHVRVQSCGGELIFADGFEQGR